MPVSDDIVLFNWLLEELKAAQGKQGMRIAIVANICIGLRSARTG
jgi:hypothetical protein